MLNYPKYLQLKMGPTSSVLFLDGCNMSMNARI